MDAITKEPLPYPLKSIYFYLTDGCNLRCCHCWIQPRFTGEKIRHQFIDLELVKSIVAQAKPLGLTSVKLTGGEPLLHPQIPEILAFIKNEGLSLVVETNGLLCNAEICRLIAGCKKAFVSVSIDAANAETHDAIRGVTGCFEAALAGVRNLVEAGLRPQIIMTVMRSNKNDVAPLVDLAESIGAGSVKINIVQPTARGEKMHQSGQTLGIEELVEMGAWIENSLIPEKKFPILYNHPHAFRPLHRMLSDHSHSNTCRIRNIIGVLGSGRYALCGIGETVPELVFGDAWTIPLADVWNHNPIIKEIRRGLPSQLKGLCSECLMKDVCLGSCLTQNYYSTRDLWSAFWYCQAAYDQGLFPKTRLRPRAER